MIKSLKAHWHLIALSCFIALYCVLISIMAINRMDSFGSYYYDLGIMNQVVHNTAHGRILEMTNQGFRANISRFAIHFDPILVLAAPFYWIYSGPQTLLIFQTVVLALGAVAVFLIAARVLKSSTWGLVFAASYLLYFPVSRQNMFDVHGVAFATTFLLYMYYFASVRRFGWSYFFMILSLMTKEHVGLVISFFGLYMYLFKKEKKFGIITSVTGIVFFMVTVFVIIPGSRAADSFYLRYFRQYGDSSGGVLSGLIRNPLSVLSHIFDPTRIEYLFQLIIPYFPFVLFAPHIVAISSPEILINLLSANPNLRSVNFHYNALTIPFIVIAAIYGFSYIRGKFDRNWLIVAGFIVITFFCFARSIRLYSPFPYLGDKSKYILADVENDKLSSVRKWQRQLADDSIVVSTTPQLAPFFTNRRIYYNFLFDSEFSEMGLTDGDILKGIDKYEAAQYVVVAQSEVLPARPHAADYMKHLIQNKRFERIYNTADIVVYKRKN